MIEQLNLLPLEEFLRKNINIQEAEKKGLIENGNYEKYQLVESLYRKVFETYIESIFSFEKIDQKLKNSPLEYTKIEEEKRDIYQKTSYIKSEYIFIRNFYYIERLNEEQLKIFINHLNNYTQDFESELLEIVKNTFKTILQETTEDGKKPLKVFYGSIDPSYCFSNGALALFINYGRNQSSLEEQSFMENKIKKEEYLDTLALSIEKELSYQLDLPVEMKHYKGKI